MESKKIEFESFTIDCYSINTLIIGSGAASLNAAVNLHNLGQKNILIATSQWGGGTSNNAGSDKQTYYKLSLSGSTPDSVTEMAQDLFNGKCMHGDIALCEAQGSVQSFINLVNLGVRFPHNKFGAWPGYKTDNDNRARATSAGPYTSKNMFEVLAAEVKRREIIVLDHHHCIALLTDSRGAKVIGALAINTSEQDYSKAFVLLNSTNIILGTGGPAGIYETSVYPLSQNGSIGMAFKAGATGQNLTESQFGIASLKFRWNLSGSYQQAIPLYFSTDQNGNDQKEFLNDFFPDMKTLSKAIFRKGYQWPFDPRKISDYGSSMIDLLVYREINEKNRKVFIDFTRNLSFRGGEYFSPENLDPVAEEYLRKSNALKGTPIERLYSINTPAVELYREHGIDLTHDPVQIAVCAQHNNGGLKANIWWESDLTHLFPVGEVCGSHGVYRPGGSALNSGQVGSFRAAQYIVNRYKLPPVDEDLFISEVKDQLNSNLALATGWMLSGSNGANKKYLSEIKKRMSESGGITREKRKVTNASDEAFSLLKELPGKIGAGSVSELADSFILLDHCLTHFIYLEAIRTYIDKGGRSRGSYLVEENKEKKFNRGCATDIHPELCMYDRDIENNILEIEFRNGCVKTNLTETRGIPEQDLWFETIWKEFLEENTF
jgi:succinate dehydrogenase/fumarate reductase flavoprotein subunit